MANVKELINVLIPDFLIKMLRKRRITIKSFAYGNNEKVAEDIQHKYNFNGDLLRLFTTNKGSSVHKWHHFIPLYERYFSPYRGKEIKFLEIGVKKGGSLQLWRQYFGDKAIIFGIDIDPTCAELNGQSAQVRIGSQTDKEFLESIIEEMGGIDIVLDDGSHQMSHVRKSLNYLFPYLSDGGIYMIEDLHTAYWKSHGGGYGTKQNFFNYLFEIVDDMHHWYHSNALRHPFISRKCAGIHIHDSIVVVEKAPVYSPVHSKIG